MIFLSSFLAPQHHFFNPTMQIKPNNDGINRKQPHNVKVYRNANLEMSSWHVQTLGRRTDDRQNVIIKAHLVTWYN